MDFFRVLGEALLAILVGLMAVILLPVLTLYEYFETRVKQK